MFLDFFRMRRQAPTTKPPKGYYDLRVSKATGALVLVDETGTEAAVGQVTSVAGRTGAVTIASADITDAVGDGTKVFLAEEGDLGDVLALRTVPGGDGLRFNDGSAFNLSLLIDSEILTASRDVYFADAAGIVAVVTSYADEAAANTAEAANVAYYNQATGKVQITTA